MKKISKQPQQPDLWIKAFGSLLLNFVIIKETGLETLLLAQLSSKQRWQPSRCDASNCPLTDMQKQILLQVVEEHT